jgi:hypothetical protein
MVVVMADGGTDRLHFGPTPHEAVATAVSAPSRKECSVLIVLSTAPVVFDQFVTIANHATPQWPLPGHEQSIPNGVPAAR